MMYYYRNEALEEESRRQEVVIAQGRALQAELQRQANSERSDRLAVRAEVLRLEEQTRSLQWQVTDLQTLVESNKTVIAELQAKCSSATKAVEEKPRYVARPSYRIQRLM